MEMANDEHEQSLAENLVYKATKGGSFSARYGEVLLAENEPLFAYY
ncbi:hypothetical protein FACS1894198_6870 [Clostridia bacterium]|nr:hypothetical protein FACS1894198_6870 [Clostridia bacterium]